MIIAMTQRPMKKQRSLELMAHQLLEIDTSLTRIRETLMQEHLRDLQVEIFLEVIPLRLSVLSLRLKLDHLMIS